MTVAELLEELQRLAEDGHGDVEVSFIDRTGETYDIGLVSDVEHGVVWVSEQA